MRPSSPFPSRPPLQPELTRPCDDFVCTVVGITFMDRYRHLEAVHAGDELRLVREPFNEVDEKAIMVCDLAFQHLGYLPRCIAVWLAPLMDRGRTARARVLKVRKGNIPYYERLVIQVKVA